jgi:hypothetical protein
MKLGSGIYKLRKILAYHRRWMAVHLRWRSLRFAGSPIVFGNAMPKSGSNLLRQILDSLCDVGPFGPAMPFPIRTITIDGRTRTRDEVADDLDHLRAGDVGWGYLPAESAYLRRLSGDGWASFFLTRDPRDLLVSHVYYATEIHQGHSMRPIYTQLPDFESRLLVAIRGTDAYPFLPSVKQRYAAYLGYLTEPSICVLRFESLRQDLSHELDRIVKWIEQRSGHRLTDGSRFAGRVRERTDPGHSPTFRKGSVGDWQHHFTPRTRRAFDDVAGDLLDRLGYPPDPAWESLA